MPLLERDAFLASLTACADDARRGEGRLVLIAGEAGVGKTALLDALEGALPEASWGWGACDGLFTPRPLGPVFDIAERWGGDLLAACADGAREAIFTALLRRLAAPGRLQVVVVEDAHWADEATLDLLRFLGRRMRGLHALLLVTYRDDGLGADDPLRAVLGELGSQRSTRRIALPPLSEAAVRNLAAASTVAPAELFRLTGGNPFFVTEVLGAGRTTLPASARDAVLARTARLPAAARHVLGLAALAGTRLEPEVLERIRPGAAAAIDACLASGVLTDDDAGLRFRHEIARLAVADAVPAHRRTAMHAALLAALRDAGTPDAARAAYHAEGAGNAEAVLEFAPAAARRAAGLAAHREAGAQYARALRFSAGRPDAEVAALYDGVATELSLVDRWQEAADAWLAALPLWRAAGDRVREGDGLRRLSWAFWRLCRGADAAATAQQALAVLATQPPGPELAWAYANVAGLAMMGSDSERAIGLARRSRELAERLDRPDVRSDALNTEACAAGNLGRPWAPLMHRALRVALDAGSHVQAGRAYANLHAAENADRRLAEADRVYEEGVEYCDAHDVATFATCLRGERTSWLERAGRWDEAVALSEELLARTVPSPINRLNPLLSLGRILVRRGDPAATDTLDEAAARADGTQEPLRIAPARLALAEHAWLAGRLDDAADQLARAAAVAGSCDAWVRGDVAVWQRRLDRPVTVSGGVAGPWALQLAGRPLDAAGAWDALGCPYEAAMARADSGDERALRAALRTLDGLGAVPTAQAVRRRMRRLGFSSVPAGPRAATRSSRFGLTRREQEVLQLVAAGLPNADISRRLFISERTVDHHVTAVLAKMGVRSRGLAAREAHRLGLVDVPEPRRPGDRPVRDTA